MDLYRAAAVLTLALLQGRGCEYHFSVGDPPQPEISSADSEHHARPLRTPAGRLKPPRGGRESEAPAIAEAEPPIEAAEPTPAGVEASDDPTEAGGSAAPGDATAPTVDLPEPSGPVVLRIYQIGDVTPDPFGRRRPPAGVELYYTERVGHRTTRTPDRGPLEGGREGGTWIGRTAQVRPREGETLAHAIARVRRWFERLPVADGERFFFDLPRAGGTRSFDSADAILVAEPAIEVHRGDIYEVAISDFRGSPHHVRVCWSADGARRLPPLTRGLAGSTIAYVADDGVLWSPRMGDGGPIGSGPHDTLVFLHGDRAFGERVRRALLRGADEVHPEPADSFLPCGAGL